MTYLRAILKISKNTANNFSAIAFQTIEIFFSTHVAIIFETLLKKWMRICKITFSIPKLKTLWFYDIQLWSNQTNKSWSCGQMKRKSLFHWLFYSTATFVIDLTSNNFVILVVLMRKWAISLNDVTKCHQRQILCTKYW